MHLVGIFFLIVAVLAVIGIGSAREFLGCLAVVAGLIVLVILGMSSSRTGTQTETPSSEPSVFYTDPANVATDTANAKLEEQKANLELADEKFNAEQYAEAAQIYKQMGASPNGIALGRLAWMYYTGHGVPQNYRTAYRLYPKAAAQGDAVAQAMLGTFYIKGEGLLQDTLQGYIWSLVAAAQGNSDGAKNRDDLAKSLSPEDIALGQDVASKCEATHYKRCSYDPAKRVGGQTDVIQQGASDQASPLGAAY